MRITGRAGRATLAACAAAAAIGAGAGAASAADGVVPGVGIAGVELRDRPPAVRAALGRPTSTRRIPAGELPPAPQYVWRWPGRTVTILSGEVVAMTTTRRKDALVARFGARPSAGAPRVGSRERQVRRWAVARNRRFRCFSDFGPRVCYLGPLSAGARATTFLIRRGVVRRITVAIVID